MKSVHQSTITSARSVNGFYKHGDIFLMLPTTQDIGPCWTGFTLEYNSKYCLPEELSDSREEGLVDQRKDLVHLTLLQELICLISIASGDVLRLSYNRDVEAIPAPQRSIDNYSSTVNLHQIECTRHNTDKGFVSNDERFDFNEGADEFFTNYFALSASERRLIKRSLLLFTAARNISGGNLLDGSYSLANVALISAIETLIAFHSRKEKTETCKECNAKIYSVNKKFKDFMCRFGNNNSALIKKMYSMRSNIVHRGELFDIDTYLTTFSVSDYDLHIDMELCVRVAIFRYIRELSIQGTP